MKITTKENKESNSFTIKIYDRFEYPEATSESLISHIPSNAKSINLYNITIDKNIENIDEYAASAIKDFFNECKKQNSTAKLIIECSPTVESILKLNKVDVIAMIRAIQSEEATAFLAKFGKR